MDRAPLNISPDGMTFDLPDNGPLLAGPAIAGGNATVRGGDGRPRVAVVTSLADRLEEADLYLIREEVLDSRQGGRELRRLKRRARRALVAGPSSPRGNFDRWPADVLVVRPSEDADQTARDALRAGVRAGGRPLLVDVAEPVPVDSIVAALDVGAAGVVIDTGDEQADAALLMALAEREAHRLDDAPLMTVAICVYNAAGDLDRCLASLRSLRYPRYEVLVCDDGSTDGTPAVGKRYAARVLELGRVGRGHARSAAIKEAFGDYVVFLDSDEEAEPQWLARLWRMHDRLGVITTGGPNRPFPDASWQERAVGGAPGVAMPIVRADGSCTHLPTCNFSIRTDVARSVGFNENLPVLGEDLHICYRLIESGRQLFFHPTASVRHHRRRSIVGYLRQMYDYGRYARATNEPLDFNLVDIETNLSLVRRLDPRRPHVCFVGPQADQRYNLAFAPLANGFPVKVMMATTVVAAAAIPAAHAVGRGRQAAALAAAALVGQVGYVIARAPAQPGARGLKAVSNRLLTAALWYAGPSAMAIGKHLSPTPEMPEFALSPEPEPEAEATAAR